MKNGNENSRRGPTWQGLYVRKTKTLKEKKESLERKHKKDLTRMYF